MSSQRPIQLSQRISSIPPSMTLGIEAKAREMMAAGKKVLSFAAGEPDFDTPPHVKEAAAKALASGQTKYAPAAGLQTLRIAISEKLARDNGLAYEPRQIVVSNGAKHSLFNVVMTICREGDEVILPSPFWLSYPEMMRVAGAKTVLVPCSEKNDFKMTPEQFKAAITPKTKAVIINSPSNPVGNIYSVEELRALADIAVAKGILIVSDEIYEKMIYGDVRHGSPGSFSKDHLALTVTVNGFSKPYAMTGWRLGYAAAPAPIADAMIALQSHSTSGPNTFAMYGALEALKASQDCVRQMVAAFEKRRTYMYERLTSIRGITCVKPGGAFYMFPNISSFGLGSIQFSDKLLQEAGMAVVPGAAFGSDANIRLSYACSTEQITAGMDKLESFVKSL